MDKVSFQLKLWLSYLIMIYGTNTNLATGQIVLVDEEDSIDRVSLGHLKRQQLGSSKHR